MSLVELTFVAGLGATLAAVAIPQLSTAVEEWRARGAIRHFAGQLQHTRQLAVSRGGHVAVRFTAVGDTHHFALFADGNGDGVRTADIGAGIDPRLTPDERLEHFFPGVSFGAWPQVPAVDPASPPPGSDPIRIGATNLLSFGPLGTATPGTLYVRSARRQYALRLIGETARVRLFEFDPRSQAWSAW